eukprot:Blabericola_migrator_1__12491@NODE_78_length_15130_cov_126_174401_g70_i0_p10_GENE_NODE_78_length_15130_cov_126_174401_g70_i0NODE_78_length_15130_cov_126_174401_g70_i0_p10_ORF_typecomplete_len182_score15_16_NODE_78_length_15130_cov_126_174401_g70_i0969710242
METLYAWDQLHENLSGVVEASSVLQEIYDELNATGALDNTSPLFQFTHMLLLSYTQHCMNELSSNVQGVKQSFPHHSFTQRPVLLERCIAPSQMRAQASRPPTTQSAAFPRHAVPSPLPLEAPLFPPTPQYLPLDARMVPQGFEQPAYHPLVAAGQPGVPLPHFRRNVKPRSSQKKRFGLC